MSGNPYVPDAATRAHEKSASEKERGAREGFMARWNKMAADWEARLVAAGITVDDKPEPDMTGLPAVNYSRRVELSTSVPFNIPALESLKKVYASEAALINSTTRAFQEFQVLFCKEGDPQLFASAQEEALMTTAFVDRQRRMTDDVLRKAHTAYYAGPPETYRVLRNSLHEELLQDWAKKRGPPNLLEVEMLSIYMNVDVWLLYDWFKARGLQTQCIDMMMGEALSHNPKWRKIGLLRYRAAKVQTKWSLHLAWLRKQHKKSKVANGPNEEDKDRSGETYNKSPDGSGDDQGSEEDSNESDADITMADVRGEMNPFISQELD